MSRVFADTFYFFALTNPRDQARACSPRALGIRGRHGYQHLLTRTRSFCVYYSDLSNECQVDRGQHVRAVGWLSKDHPFSTGEVPPDFLVALHFQLSSAFQPVVMMGPHFCEFCRKPTAGPGWIGGYRNIWIPTQEKTYVAPELIIHYIEAHSYHPPNEFIAAVLACPEQESPEFYKLLRSFPCWWEST